MLIHTLTKYSILKIYPLYFPLFVFVIFTDMSFHWDTFGEWSKSYTMLNVHYSLRNLYSIYSFLADKPRLNIQNPELFVTLIRLLETLNMIIFISTRIDVNIPDGDHDMTWHQACLKMKSLTPESIQNWFDYLTYNGFTPTHKLRPSPVRYTAVAERPFFLPYMPPNHEYQLFLSRELTVHTNNGKACGPTDFRVVYILVSKITGVCIRMYDPDFINFFNTVYATSPNAN